MRKVLLWVLVVLGLLVVAPLVALPLIGLSPTDLKANVAVGTGMGGKRACSGRYLTQLDEAQVIADLTSYSAASEFLSIAYDDTSKTARASLFGLAPTTAKFREGLGCTLEIGDTSALDDLQAPRPAAVTGPWPKGEGANPIVPTLQASLDGILSRDNAAGLQTRGLVVIHKGQLVAESYARGFAPTSALLGWSMGKSLMAIMFGRLEMLGEVTVTQTSLFQAWQADERRNISLEHLLRMSSGLDFAEVYAPASDATHMLFTAHSASDVALASPAAHPPGQHFAYSSGTTNLLSRLLVERLGSPQAALNFLVQEIYTPLGMLHSTLEPDPSGVFVASSYIYSSPRDWARLGQLMLNRGELNGHRLISAAWVARAVTPNVSANDPRYGYQFWLNGGGDVLRWPGLPEDAYAMNGNRQQVVMVVPSANAVLVRLGWTAGGYPLEQNFAELLEQL